MKQIKIDGQLAPFYITEEGKLFRDGAPTGPHAKEFREQPYTFGTTSKYAYWCFHYKGKRVRLNVQRTVAEHFIEKPDNWTPKWCVHHKNRDILDNRVCNLEWLTTKDNIAQQDRPGFRHHDKTQLFHKDELVNEFESVIAACKYASAHYNVSKTSLHKYKHCGDCKIVKV